MSVTPPSLQDLRIDRASADAPERRPVLPWVLLGLVVVVGAALWLLLAPRAVAVETGTATATGGGTVSSEGISANGYVVARTKASVSAKVMGRLEYLGVREGSRVRKGEVLARIESDVYRAAVASEGADIARAQAELVQARRELERARRLQQEQVLAQAALEDAGTRVEVLEAQLQSARARRALAAANLEDTRVRAPFDGTVLRKDAEVGEIVAPAAAGGGLTRTAIVTMADLGTLEVEVDVNEAYIAQIQNGQPARIVLDAYPDTSFTGTVRQVVPTADRTKAAVQVKVAILDKDPRILPEMGAKVVFVRERGGPAAAAAPRRVLVPEGAVVGEGEAARVWVVQDGRAKAQAVAAGAQRNGQVEIRSGLSGGETVVIAPPAGLKDGARVRVGNS